MSGTAGTAGGTAAAAPASQAAGGTTDLSCGLAPASVVGPALGVTGLGDPVQTTAPTGATCLYSGPSGTVTVNLISGASSDKMTLQQQAMDKTEPTQPYPGLGDQAFSASLSVGSGVPSANTLAARKGAVEVMVVSQSSLTAEKSLAEQLLAKIG